MYVTQGKSLHFSKYLFTNNTDLIALLWASDQVTYVKMFTICKMVHRCLILS